MSVRLLRKFVSLVMIISELNFYIYNFSSNNEIIIIFLKKKCTTLLFFEYFYMTKILDVKFFYNFLQSAVLVHVIFLH
jgi:hypothetical protein